MFLLLSLWARVLFDSGASHSLVATSRVKELGLKVETLEEPLHVSSLLGTGVRIDQICQDCELEISRILLTMDLKVMDMSEFDVILGMDWLTAHQVVIDYDRNRVTIYTLGGSHFIFQGNKIDVLPHTVHNSSKSTRNLLHFKGICKNGYQIETMKECNTKCLYITFIVYGKKLIVEKLSTFSSALYYTTIKSIESYVVMHQKFIDPKIFIL